MAATEVMSRSSALTNRYAITKVLASFAVERNRVANESVRSGC